MYAHLLLQVHHVLGTVANRTIDSPSTIGGFSLAMASHYETQAKMGYVQRRC